MKQATNQIICDISDKTFNPSFISSTPEDYRVRKAARGILINNGKIALLNVHTKGYHKLPGGGIETGETNEEGFIREILEETGCNCKIMGSAGVTIEYRDQFKLLQISYVFIAEVIGEPGLQKLEQGEIDEGHDLEWLTLEKAADIFARENPTVYEDKFIHLRDKSIFEYYKDTILQRISV